MKTLLMLWIITTAMLAGFLTAKQYRPEPEQVIVEVEPPPKQDSMWLHIDLNKNKITGSGRGSVKTHITIQKKDKTTIKTVKDTVYMVSDPVFFYNDMVAERTNPQGDVH